MTRIGTNVGYYPAPHHLHLIDQLRGIQTVRFPLRRDTDDSWFVAELRKRQIAVTVVLASDSVSDYPSFAEAITDYKERYWHLSVNWQIGNEPDHVSPSSWTLPAERLNVYTTIARDVLGPEAYITLGGLVSGDPSYLDHVDLRSVNAIGVHPYGKWPSSTSPREGWGYGPVADLLLAYREKLNTRNAKRVAIHVTEYGVPRGEIPNVEAYLRDMAHAIAATGLVGDINQFCLSDKDVAPYGLFDQSGTLQSALPTLRPEAVAPSQPSPVAPAPEVPEVVRPPAPQFGNPLDAVYFEVWSAVRLDIAYNPEFGVPYFWRQNYRVLGAVLGPERLSADGLEVYQPFVGGIVAYDLAASRGRFL